LVYRRGSPASEAALRLVEERLRAVNDRWLAQQLGIGNTRLARFMRQAIEAQHASTFSLATLAPLILILMTVTGAVYPAIDLTAGERERNTLETLIAAPVPRMSLLLAKYIAVLTVALLTAMVNFAAMTLTVIGGGLGPYLFGPAGLRLSTVVQVFGLTILFAAFFAAVLLAVTSFARSFKEAQAYLIPLTLVSLAPGFLAFTPGLELNGALALAPLANIVLVARDLLQGDVEPWWTIVAVLSTAVYAVAALAVAARVFGADALLFGADDSWTAWLLRPRTPRAAAPLGNALICLAVLLPSYLLLAGGLNQLRGAPLATRLMAAGLVTSLLFGLIPLAAALVGRVSLRDGFALRSASVWAWIGAAVLGFSLWPFAHEIFLVNRLLGWVSLDEPALEPAMRLVEQLSTTPLWLVLIMLAVAPAVFEEFFFRGYLFGAIGARSAAAQTILLTAVLFGLFHVFSSVLAIERMLPSTFLGLVLGWVRWRSGSVLPGMLLHAAHNGLLLTLAYHHEALIARGWGVQEQSHLPPAWLAAAVVATVLGAVLVWNAGLSARQSQQVKPAPEGR
jgi:ABC-2 type transport system permease protein/sodium transport system permease protein